MAKHKQSKGTDELIPEGAPEPQPDTNLDQDTQIEPEPAGAPRPAPEGTFADTSKPQSRATGAKQGQGVTHFQKLASSDGETLAFTTEEELAKYNQDVRTVNNLQLEDPVRFQAEHGYWPKRGDTTIDKRGLTAKEQEEVLIAKKKLEGPDDQGNFKAVPVK